MTNSNKGLLRLMVQDGALSETGHSDRQKLPRPVSWRVGLTRASLVWEILWSASWPASGLIGVYLALSLLDVWLYLPGIAQALSLLATVGGTGYALFHQLKHQVWPTRDDALRRMELSADLGHRPLSELDDVLSAEPVDEATGLLWRQHKARQREALDAVHASTPVSDLPVRDPAAVRVMVAMVLIVSAFVAGGDAANRLRLAFQPGFSFGFSDPAAITAWVNPPDFTGLAPIFLDPESQTSRRLVAVPQNSVLVIRVTDARSTPVLHLPGSPSRVKAETLDAGMHEFNQTLVMSGEVRLRDQGRTLGHWRFSVTPDATPFAAFEEAPKENDANGLEFSYRLEDDYAIGSAALAMQLDVTLDGETGSAMSEDERRLAVDLPLGAAGQTSISERTVLDLTELPFAGLDVTAELVVRDLGGQEGRSQVVRFTIPERDFFEPLALAIIEQRRNLARDPSDWAYVMRALEALTLAPERFFDDLTAYIGLRSVYWQLDRSMPESLGAAMPSIDLLWDLALHVEDGNLSLAEQELKAIAKALQNALARGAPMDEIQRLLKRYQEALERYLAALAEKALAAGEDPATPPQGGDSVSVDQQDLLDLLKAIEDLARTGDREGAAELMAQLQRMLENMTMSAQGGMNGPESELAKKIEELSDLIGKERALMDETLRRSQESEGEDGAPDDGGQHDLANEQGSLRGDLEGLGGSEGLEGSKGSGTNPMDDAGRAMRDAEGALRGGDNRQALHAERRAIDAMREAAEGLAKELQRSMEARGASGAGNQSQDPLGRREGTNGQGLGNHIKIPEERDLQRAREILEELKKRASDPNRPDLELDYLERLLKRF